MLQVLMYNSDGSIGSSRLAQRDENIQNIVGAVRIVPHVELSQLLTFRHQADDGVARIVVIAR